MGGGASSAKVEVLNSNPESFPCICPQPENLEHCIQPSQSGDAQDWHRTDLK